MSNTLAEAKHLNDLQADYHPDEERMLKDELALLATSFLHENQLSAIFSHAHKNHHVNNHRPCENARSSSALKSANSNKWKRRENRSSN